MRNSRRGADAGTRQDIMQFLAIEWNLATDKLVVMCVYNVTRPSFIIYIMFFWSPSK